MAKFKVLSTFKKCFFLYKYILTLRAHSGLFTTAPPYKYAAAAALLNSRYRQKGDAVTANTNSAWSYYLRGGVRSGPKCLRTQPRRHHACAGVIVRYLAASAAGKQPLFNLRRPNLRGRSIHQGQLPTQSAGGYLHPPLSDVRCTPGVLPSRRSAKTKAPQFRQPRNWVVRLRDTGQRRSVGPGRALLRGCNLADVSPKDNRNLLEISLFAQPP